MGQGGSHHKGVGKALAEERVRAEIAVKLHMAIGGKAAHREVLQSAFQSSDADGDGTIDFDEFCSTASAIGIGVSEPELRFAFAKFDRNGDNSVEFQEVIDFMCPSVKTHRDAQQAAHVEMLTRMAESREALEVEEDTEAAVNDAVRRVATVVYDKEINIRSAFRTWDRDGSGKLDVSEFVSAMNSLGFSMDLADARHVFKAFDVDGDGKLACWEFVRTLGAFESELNNPDGLASMPGHNTGRGGGGDVVGKPPPPKPATPKKSLAEKSRAQAEMERQQREAAQREIEEARRREAEALRMLEAQQAAMQRNAMMQQQQGAYLAAQQQAAREEELRRRSMMAEAQRQAEASALREAAERAQAAQEAMAAELASMKQREQDLASGNVSASGLRQFSSPTSKTDVFDKGVYAWTASSLDDSLSDAAIIDALKKRLKYVHTTPSQALASCCQEPSLAANPDAYHDYGVDQSVLIAFAGQLLYNLSEGRAAQLLTNISGGLPIVPVPMFLSLFGQAGGGGGMAQLVKINPVLERHKRGEVERLSDRERKLLTSLREFLFEQHSRMKSMFERCDPDGSGYVSIEEFLKAMQRAGIAFGRGLDRQRDDTISTDEAANILAFFDKDKDGYLQYHEFMTMLQHTKNSVLSQVLTKHEA